MFLGIDLGTSGVKAVVLDRDSRVRAAASAPLSVSQPQRLWREQDPADWWTACDRAVRQALEALRADGATPQSIDAIGLTGQMHGATLLDAGGEVLRLAILWNDGRAHAECAELERRVPDSRAITGNLMMPGFTAPKLLWLQRHEPSLFARIDKVLLPKDWLRWRMTGDFASDMSDAAGTLWLDVAGRRWNEALLRACGLGLPHMPRLHEGPEVTGQLASGLARDWGLRQVPVVAGAGDNAAGALGVGVVSPGQAMLSLGTSGVCFAVTGGFAANPAQAVHSFCHALPNTWHLMSVMLSAAACLDFTARLLGRTDVPALLAQAEARGLDDATPLFLPYLNGERTPHNDPAAQGVFFGLHPRTEAADLVNATLEGVCHGLAQGVAAIEGTGTPLKGIELVGGGARSPYWAQLLADATGRNLLRRADAEVGPALGAARLAWIGCDGVAPSQACAPPPLLQVHEPRPQRHAWLRARRERFAELYRQLQPCFPAV